MSCERITKTNGEVSDLFNTLLSIANNNEAVADELYSYFYTPEFKEIFGDFEIEYNSANKNKGILDRVDENYEPKLYFNDSLNRYYFKDINEEKIYYPYDRQGLSEHLETVDINIFARSLAFNYYKDNVKFDFDNLSFVNEHKVKLRDYIKEYIDLKVEDLLESSNPDYVFKGIALENTKNNIDEWLIAVEDIYESFKISVIEETVEEQESVHYDDLIRTETFLKNSKDNVTNNIKLFLSLIETDERNSFDELSFVDFNDIYSTLNKSLKNVIPIYDEQGNLEDPYELYLDIIKQVSIRKPYLSRLHEILSSDIITEDFKNQFVAGFNLYRNNFLGTEINEDPETGEITYTTRNLSDVNSKKNDILNQWFYNYRQLDPTGVIKRIDKGIALITRNLKNIDSAEDLNYYLQSVKDVLNSIGIEFTQRGFDFYMSDFQYEDPGVEFKKKKLLDVLYSTKRALDNKNEVEDIFRDQSTFVKMADAEAFFLNEGSDASLFALGKSKWIYSLPSYIDIKVELWKKNRDELLKLYNSTPYTRGSKYMKYLLALEVEEDTRIETSKKRINEIEVGIFNSFQRRFDAINGVDNKDISKLDVTALYLNKVLAFRKNAKVYYKTPVAGDKSTQYEINYGNVHLRTNASNKDGVFEIDDEVLETFFEYFEADYNRIAYEYVNEESNIKNYSGQNALKSQTFPSLSDNSVIELYDVNGKPLYTSLEEVKGQIKEHIKKSLYDNIQRLYNSEYITTILENNLVDTNIKKTYDSNFNLVADAYVNSTISSIEYSKMFSGDVAYYKDLGDYIKRTQATYTDGRYMRILKGQERFKIAVLPSQIIPSPSLENMKEMLTEDVYKYYSAINTTDAQAWITPERWKFIMQGIGRWDSNTEKIYKKFFKDKPVFTKEELKVLAQPLKGVYFNVDEKGVPVYLKYSQAVLLPNLIKGTDLQGVYDKMKELGVSELVAEDGIKSGSVIPDSDFSNNIIELDNRYWKLQQQLSTKNIKDTDIGSQIQKNIFAGLVYNEDSIFNVNNKEYSNTELINHLNDLFSNLSSIGKRSLFERLGINPDTYRIENEDVLYEAMIDQLKTRSDIPDNFIRGLRSGLSPYGIPGYFTLFQSVFSSTVNKNIVKYQSNGGEFIQMSDYGLSKNEAASQGVMFTPWFKDSKPVPPKVIGKNEETGLEIIEPGGIFLSGAMIAKYIPDYKELSDKELFGALNEETGKYEGGVIDHEILTSIIGYRIPNQALASSDALQIVGILPEEIGNTIVPYVGTTTKTGSDFDIDKMFLMIPYFRPIYNDKKKAYQFIDEQGITLPQMRHSLLEVGYNGVDKMTNQSVKEFFIEDVLLYGDSRESKFGRLFDETVNLDSADSLKYIKFDDNTPIVQQSKEAIINQIIEVYKSILLHPDVINDVMKPIDLDFMKKDIKSLLNPVGNVLDNSGEATVAGATDLEYFDPFKDIEYQEEYRQGKAGLGQNVLSLIDSVRSSMAELYFREPIGWGHDESNYDRGTIFDLEYHEVIEGYPTYKITDVLTALVNGFVDVVKDPYVVQGNWVTQTNGVGFMLVRAGAHPFKVNAFLNQPIIKSYVNYRSSVESISINKKDEYELELAARMLEQNSKYTKKDMYDNVTYVDFNKIYRGDANKLLFRIEKSVGSKDAELANAILDVLERFHGLRSNETNVGSMTIKQLRDQILEKSDFETQILMLQEFKKLVQISRKLNYNVLATTIDTKGKGKDITSAIIANNRIQKLLAEEHSQDEWSLQGFSRKLTSNGKDTMLGAVNRNAIEEILKIFTANPKFFFTGSTTSVETFNVISTFINDDNLTNEYLGNLLEKDYYHYILSGFPPLSMTKEEKIELLKTMPSELVKLKKETDNLLIHELVPKPTDTGSSIIAMNSSKKGKSVRDRLINSWEDLFISHPEFAEKLIKYAFISTGFNNNINQFHEYIPTMWFNRNRFNSYLKQLSLNEQSVDKNFVDQFFRNNYDNTRIVKNVFKNQIKGLEGDQGFLSGFTMVNNPEHDNYMYKMETTTPYGEVFFKYYKLVGYNSLGQGVYVRTSVLSAKDSKNNNIKEYNINTNDTSMFPQNRLLANHINQEILTNTKNNPNLNDPFISKDYFKGKYELELEEDTTIGGDLSTYTNHSGGAIGADTMWDSIGAEYGMVKNNHYYIEGQKTPKGNVSLSQEIALEADDKLRAANVMMKRKFPTSSEKTNNLLRRNWAQVKNAEAVFAIATIKNNIVQGGTGWAVHMAINENKPVYVFDQNQEKWFTSDGGSFFEIETPILTPNFAGIGTREINKKGIQAIRDVYEKTKDDSSTLSNDPSENDTNLFELNTEIESVIDRNDPSKKDCK